MEVEASVSVQARKEKIWKFITDYSKWPDHIKAILSVNVIEDPGDFLGFKWQETRKMYGKESSEIMVVTEVIDYKMYKTRAESHGVVYITTVAIEEKDDHCILSQIFEGRPQKIMAKLMTKFMGNMIMNSTQKALKEDLLDIKNYVENYD